MTVESVLIYEDELARLLPQWSHGHMTVESGTAPHWSARLPPYRNGATAI